MGTTWTENQKLAIDKEYGNILVSASAGSGKTSVLIERVISKVLKKQTDIDSLLIVTFTNASASELKEKLIKAIYKEIDRDPKNQFLKRQLVNINIANINTIHSFCLKIIRQNFYLLNIDPMITVCDETTSNLLKAKAMQTIIEEEYSKYSQDQMSFGIYQVLELFNSKEEDLIDSMLEIYRYIQSFAHPIEWLSSQIDKYINKDNSEDLYNYDFGREIYQDIIDEVKILLAKTNGYLELLQTEPDYTKYIDCINSDIEGLERILKCSNNSWDMLYENILLYHYINYPRNKVLNEEPKKIYKKFRDNYLRISEKTFNNTVYAKSDKIFEEIKSAHKYLEYILNLLSRFDEEFSKLKLESNYLDYNDIEHMALKLLIKKEGDKYEFTDIARKYQEKIKEVYIDEYQDTSFVQEAILEAISGSKNRFMVGDIKQSIYRFRQAMPEIFNRKYTEYELLKNIDKKEDTIKNENKAHKIILSDNFRSRETVINSINHIFKKIMSSSVGECEYTHDEELKFGAKYYVDNPTNDYPFELNVIDVNKKNTTVIDSETLNSESLDSGTNEYNNGFDGDDNSTDSTENFENTKNVLEELKDFEIETKYIAKKVQEIVSEKNFKICTADGFRDPTYRDIVILLRSVSNKGILLERSLKEINIPVFSDANSNYFENDEIKLVLSFLQIIDNPLQDIPLVSVMFSIIGGFSIDELTLIHNELKNDYLFNAILKIQKEYEVHKETISGKLFDKICKFLDLYNKFCQYSRVYSVSELIIHIYNQTNIYHQFVLTDKVKEVKASLDYLVELARRFEENNSGSVYSYISYVDNVIKKSESKEISAKIIGENENVVRIMTIHKSKGLEFPIVILCDTSAKYNSRDIHKNIVLHHNLGIGINYVDEDLKITYPCVIKQAIKNMKIKEIKSEELRMLYVALTRAKEKLIVFGNVKNFEKMIEEIFVLKNKEGIIDPIIVEKNSSYFKNICLALKDEITGKEVNDNFKLNVIKVYEDKNILKSVENDTVKNETIWEKVSKIKKLANDKQNNEQKEVIQSLKSNVLEFTYPNKTETVTENRVSVSKLKKQNEDIETKHLFNADGEEKTTIEYNDKFSLKRLLNEENAEDTITAARKGTLIHFILEHMDFKNLKTKEQINDYLQNLVKDGVINTSDLKQINVDSIYNFLNSKIGKALSKISDDRIFREVEFVLKDKTFSDSVIQGVIDLYYFVESDRGMGEEGIVLVDFKTDKISDEREFIEKYALQLKIYKSALEKLLGKGVENSYIYSFYLNKEIEVNC